MSINNGQIIATLRHQAETLSKLGEAETALKLLKRAESMEKETAPIIISFEEGRFYIQTNRKAPGGPKFWAFKNAVKEAGQGTGRWDPKRKAWHFETKGSIVDAVKQVYSNFYGRVKLVNADGKSLGFLPEPNFKK